MTDSLHSGDSSLFKSWSLGVGWGHNEECSYIFVYNTDRKTYFKNLLSNNHWVGKAEIYLKAI
jgi:hypothetical protein